MPVKALKYVVKKNKASVDLLQNIAQSINVEFAIGLNGKILFGELSERLIVESPIEIEGIAIATLHSSQSNNELLLQTIVHLVRLELEKKKIGSEVLGLYREINMIYDFSEQLAEKLDINQIGQIALQEGCNITHSDAGMVFRLDEQSGLLRIISEMGVPIFDNSNINKYQPILKRLLAKGNSGIADLKWLSEIPELSFLNALMFAPLRIKHHSIGLMLLGRTDSGEEYRASDLKLLTTMSIQAATAMETAYLFERNIGEALKREEAIRKIHEFTNRFVPHEFIKSLGKSKLTEVQLGDLVEREVTVMFADIREFTTLSEQMSPEDNFKFINGFNMRMGPVIRDHYGFINQYLGDGFMAIFPAGPKYALEAAVQMQLTLQEYNEIRSEKNRMAIRMGVGMQTGPLIMGITGDQVRLDAATISDTVNTASRIESLSKHYGANILLSEDSVDKLDNIDDYHFRYLGEVLVKGKAQPIKIFECTDGDNKDLFLHKLETKEMFDQGMSQYVNKEFAMAAVSFQTVAKGNSDDKTAKLMLKKAAKLITEEVSEDWRGVETLHFK